MNVFKVVFHVDEVSKWNLILVNVKNFVEDIADAEYSIEIVANAEAVTIFADNRVENIYDLLEEMEFLIGKNVKISVCRNALRANAIEERSLPEFISIVSAGVTRLAILQRQGYSYIKP
ncbi:MAG: DsrE family protein [Acidaminococcaceae bacterium]|nr:DsrE family protein [Acidaminococcaceae bacterium]